MLNNLAYLLQKKTQPIIPIVLFINSNLNPTINRLKNSFINKIPSTKMTYYFQIKKIIAIAQIIRQAAVLKKVSSKITAICKTIKI